MSVSIRRDNSTCHSHGKKRDCLLHFYQLTFFLISLIPCPCHQVSCFAVTAISREALQVPSLEYVKHFSDAMQGVLRPYAFTQPLGTLASHI